MNDLVSLLALAQGQQGYGQRPLFDLYMACIELIEEVFPEYIPHNLHDPLEFVVAARKKLGLCQRNETKALTALRASGG